MASQAPNLGVIVRSSIQHLPIRRIHHVEDRMLCCVRDKSFEIFNIESESKLKSIVSYDPTNALIKSLLVLPSPVKVIVFVLQVCHPKEQPYDVLVFFSPYDGLKTWEHYLGRESDSASAKMAADSRGRLLAVTRESKHIILYRLDQGNPLQDERHIFLDDQIIWFLEFVTSAQADPDTAYLIAITGRHMYLCKIDCTKDISSQRLEATHLTDLDQLQFILPLKNSPGLILGTKDYVGILLDVTHPGISRHPYAAFDSGTTASQHPKALRKVAVSASVTHHSCPDQTQARYAERAFWVDEHGLIESLVVGIDSGQVSRVDNIIVGSLGFPVDEAFTVLEQADDNGWVFVAGGSYSNGGLVYFNADANSATIRRTMIIANPEPVIDSVTVPTTNGKSDLRKRVFATTNRGAEFGSISEIRYGYSIRQLEEIETKEADFNTIISKIWVLPYKNEYYLVTATATGSPRHLYRFRDESHMLQLPEVAQQSSWSKVDRATDHPLFRMFEDDEDTIAFAFVHNGCFIRVTRLGIEKIDPDPSAATPMVATKLHNCNIMQAHIDPIRSTVLLVIFRSGAWVLCYLSILHPQQTDMPSFVLEGEPSCIYTYHGEYSVAILSTQNGMLQIYALDQSSIRLLGVHATGVTDSACESLLLLTRDNGLKSQDSKDACLLCGFRSGLLACFDFVVRNGDVIIHKRGSISIGSTTVRIASQSASNSYPQNSAIIACEDIIYLFVDNGHDFSETNIKELWLTDCRGRGLRLPAILSVEVIPDWPHGASLELQDVFFVTKDTVWRGRIDSNGRPQYIPRQICVGGSPHRIIWSDRHKRLIVGLSLELVVPSDPQSSARRKTLTFPAIAVINPDQDEEQRIKSEQEIITTNVEEIISRYAVVFDSPGERISSLADWNITQDGQTYHMLLVGVFAGSSDGKVYVYNFKNPVEPMKLKGVGLAKGRGPVRCVAAYDSASCIVATDRFLLQLSIILESGSWRFRETAGCILQSPTSRAIRVHGNRIFIGTKDHSLSVFELRDQRLVHVLDDVTGGNCYDSLTVATPLAEHANLGVELTIQLCHIPTIDGPVSQISGLHHTYSTEVSQQFVPVFHHTIPTHITRLQQASLRPRLRRHPQLLYPQILASTLDGAWYSIDIIDLNLLRLLKVLQQRWLASSPASITSSASPRRFLDYDVGTSQLEGRAVDGDVLRRILYETPDPEAWVMKALFNVPAGSGVEGENHNRAETIISLLRSLVDAP